MKKTLLVAMLASSMFFNTACTDEEIQAGAVGVAIGIGIAAGAHDHDHHHHDNRRPPNRYPGPGYGRPRPAPVRPGYGHGPNRPHRRYAANMNVETSPVFNESFGAPAEALAFADKHHISFKAATKIQVAFANVETQGLSSFASIGLKKADLKDIAKGDMPESDTLKAMAGKLDLTQAQARDLIKVLINEFADQAANMDSPYWQSCMAKGQWRTPQNLFCKSTSTNGCAPSTGATLCY